VGSSRLSRPTSATALPFGIDVSHHNGRVDWNAAAKAGVVFAFAKATEGPTFVDGWFANHWKGLRDAGLLRGAYHFFRPSKDPLAQADHFCDTVGPLGPGNLPPVLDIEDTPLKDEWKLVDGVDARLDLLDQWVGRVVERLGRRPIFYTSGYFWRGTLGNSPRFADLLLWIARYGAKRPSLPGAWKDWAFWQYGDQGTLPGLAETFDVDRFNGTLEELRALAGLLGQTSM
jgi:lysozyme